MWLANYVSLVFTWMAILKSGQTIGVAVHHSVYTPAKNLSDLKVQAKLFNDWHKSKSWAETTKTPSTYPYISYHYLMATDGSMLKVTQEQYVKYHAGDNFRGADSFNLHGIAVCLTGNYENDKPTEAQMKALVLFIRDVERRYKIDARVRGHKETSETATACPGKNIGTSKSGWLKSVITNVNNKDYPPTPPVTPPVDPEITKLKAQITVLEKTITSKDIEITNLKKDNAKLKVDLLNQIEINEENSDELETLQKKYDVLYVERNRLENERNEVIRQLNECKLSNAQNWLEKLWEILFGKKS